MLMLAGILGVFPYVFLLLSLTAGCWGCDRSCFVGQKFPQVDICSSAPFAV